MNRSQPRRLELRLQSPPAWAKLNASYRRVGELPEDVRQQVEILPLEELENLGEALLDFSSMADLQAWLEENVSR